MANHEWETDQLSEDRWVNDRLAALASDRDWIPDGARTLARLREKSRARTATARRWIWTTAAAAGAGAALLLVPASRACAQQPGACVQRLLGASASPGPAPASTENIQTREPSGQRPAPAPASQGSRHSASANITASAGAKTEGIPARNGFREVGSASATLCVEIYLDYQCPHCETFVRDVVPLLTERYVATGKVRLLYRDYPLPAHRYARLAARYADAAGALGYYDAVMRQLFATRQSWSETGDIDTHVAQVLPADVMDKVRRDLNDDPRLDDSLSADLAAGREDHLSFTPFVVLVSGKERQAIADTSLSFESVSGYLDKLLQ